MLPSRLLHGEMTCIVNHNMVDYTVSYGVTAAAYLDEGHLHLKYT
jgi:hypothetical protein